MKKILFFICFAILCINNTLAVSRVDNNMKNSLSNSDSGRNVGIKKTTKSQSSRNTVNTNRQKATNVVSRPILNSVINTVKSPTRISANSRSAVVSKTTEINSRKQTKLSRAASSSKSDSKMIQTRTGTEYQKCKNAYFTCMDQFCTLKNDDYRRCSCSDKVYDFIDTKEILQKASEQLTEFTENLDIIGYTKEQALSMKTSSEGEEALLEDKSASKQLLQAIMNSISGTGDTSVGGKYNSLNSLTLSFDSSNAFGTSDTGQLVASYNGTELYQAVFSQCREAVKDDCNDSSLQRAITAYLMAIEQDCNTVASALENSKKQLNASVHEGSATLDLARVENRQKHNSDDIATCLVNVETAIQSEEVCGKNYYKCLDNGKYIDVTTGAPITGVVDFYKLGEILSFKEGTDIANQKLSEISRNKDFIQNFESKTKKFATEALDKCVEKADTVWKEYLDRALLDIYYAQNAKVSEIKNSCFDLIANCYDNSKSSITKALSNLTGDYTLSLQPELIKLSSDLCAEYVDSCNDMFSKSNNGENIIKTYMANKDKTDVTDSCRAIAQNCFDKYGGTNYTNFVSQYSGLFSAGEAIQDWFTLDQVEDTSSGLKKYKSICAQELSQTTGCEEFVENVIGGFSNGILLNSGVATEVYNNIINYLTVQCSSVGGYFLSKDEIPTLFYNSSDLCTVNTSYVYINNDTYKKNNESLYYYFLQDNENVCPAGYTTTVDTQSWGICSCWENGARRSKNGLVASCLPILPAKNAKDAICTDYNMSTSIIGEEKCDTGTVTNCCTYSNGKIKTTTVTQDGTTINLYNCECPETRKLDANEGDNYKKIGSVTGYTVRTDVGECIINGVDNKYKELSAYWQQNSADIDDWCTQNNISSNNQVCGTVALSLEDNKKKCNPSVDNIVPIHTK